MSAVLPFVGPLISGAFNLGATKSRVHGATEAASEIEKRQMEALQYLTGRAQQGRNDILEQSALGKEYLEPYINAGHGAIDTLSGEVQSGALNRPFTLADFQRDPGYEFRRDEGQRGITSGAMAGGGLFSGGTLKALDKYNQNFASNEFAAANKRFTDSQTQRFGQLFGLGQEGRAASTTAAGMNQQTGEQLLGQALPTAELGGSYLSNIGYANAAARAARGSAYGDFYSNLGSQLSGPGSDLFGKGLDYFRRPRAPAGPVWSTGE